MSIKSLDPKYYRRITKGWLEPALEGTEQVYRAGKHVEVSTLMVTDLSDDEKTARGMAAFVGERLSPEVPTHFVRFHPDYKMTDTIRTPIDRLEKARGVALGMGLKHVYLGNVYDTESTHTWCGECGQLQVTRYGLNADLVGLDGDGRCVAGGSRAPIKPLPDARRRGRVQDLPAGEHLDVAGFGWHGDVRALHVQLRNTSDTPARAYTRRYGDAAADQGWEVIDLVRGRASGTSRPRARPRRSASRWPSPASAPPASTRSSTVPTSPPWRRPPERSTRTSPRFPSSAQKTVLSEPDQDRERGGAVIHGTDYRVLPFADGTSAVLITGNHRLLLAPAGTAQRLESGVANLLPRERQAWDRLRAGGGIDDETNRSRLRESALSDGADFAVNVNLTNVCNLACTYCFAEGGDYGRITGAMGEHSIAWIFDFIDRNAAPGQRVRFEFFGGEPLANFGVIRKICERARGVAERDGTEFVHRVSTNLTLMPQGIEDLFREYRFIVSVSIDGGREAQDANRPSKNGKGSYDRIVRNLGRLREACGGDITLVARMTIATAEPTLKDNVLALWQLNLFDYFQIYPGVYPVEQSTKVPVALTLGDRKLSEPQGIEYINHFLQPGIVEQFREFLVYYPNLFDPGNRFRGVLEYERTVQMVAEGATALAFCSGGRTYYTHSPDGSVSPCHRLVGDQSFDVGTGADGITRHHPEWRRTVDEHPVCGWCWARYLCGGGCRQENHVASGDVNDLNNESCQYQLVLAEEVIKMLARSGAGYRDRPRTRFDDLFVSCGRPVVPNDRPAVDLTTDYEPFQVLC